MARPSDGETVVAGAINGMTTRWDAGAGAMAPVVLAGVHVVEPDAGHGCATLTNAGGWLRGGSPDASGSRSAGKTATSGYRIAKPLN